MLDLYFDTLVSFPSTHVLVLTLGQINIFYFGVLKKIKLNLMILCLFLRYSFTNSIHSCFLRSIKIKININHKLGLAKKNQEIKATQLNSREDQTPKIGMSYPLGLFKPQYNRKTCLPLGRSLTFIIDLWDTYHTIERCGT